MNTLQLTRLMTQGNAVWGAIDLPLGNDLLRITTLENADFLIPTGKYPLRMTYSPKWRKNMLEICDVPEREGIRIHTGTIPEHSTGCVLVSAFAKSNLETTVEYFNKFKDENEEFYIEVCGLESDRADSGNLDQAPA